MLKPKLHETIYAKCEESIIYYRLIDFEWYGFMFLPLFHFAAEIVIRISEYKYLW